MLIKTINICRDIWKGSLQHVCHGNSKSNGKEEQPFASSGNCLPDRTNILFLPVFRERGEAPTSGRHEEKA